MPYKEHSCRLLNPALFKTCRRTTRKSDDKEYSILTCQYKKTPEGKSDWAEQAYRYDKEVWTEKQAKAHCELKEGYFEPAIVEAKEKDMVKIDLTVVGSKTLPVDERYEWDGDAATLRMRKLASSDGSGDKDKVNFEAYKRGFLFRGEDVKNFGSYKLPFADEINGKLTAVWGGIARSMGALRGARTPVDIPDRYKRNCYNVLAVYYKKLEKNPPEFRLNELLQEFRFGFLIPKDIKLSKKHLMDIEILREGKWTHPEAPDGVLEIEKSDLEIFQKNFEEAVVGDRLPVDLEHKPEKGHAIGWIIKLWQTLKNGSWHLWAKIDVTDEKVREDLKNGSLRYISPQILINWMNPEDNEDYDLIRSAGLTNYPFIKGMAAAIVNFSEIEGGDKTMSTEKELKELEETLKTKKVELEDKEKKLNTREEDITTKETDVETKENDIKERQLAIDNAVKEIETQNSFHGLPKAVALELAKKANAGEKEASALLIKFATGGVYGYTKTELMDELKELGIEVEDLPQFESAKEDTKLEARVAELEKDSKDKGTALKAALDQLQSVNGELENEKVEAKLNELGVTPAKRDLLKGILLSRKGGKIKLTEKEGKKDVKKELSVAEAVVKLISGDEPFRVEPGQESILTPRSGSSIKMREGVDKVLGISQEDWDKLPEDQRNSILKQIGGGE